MRLINVRTLDFQEFRSGDIPPYAILSHRWGEGEVTYKDWKKRRDSLSGPGYEKVIDFCRLVRDMEPLSWVRNAETNEWDPVTLEWIWIDTCCIDKRSSAELSEAINSMYSWYQKAVICFVHLYDYLPQEGDAMQETLGRCEWFGRGWTLQELLAPACLCFCDKSWKVFAYVTGERCYRDYTDIHIFFRDPSISVIGAIASITNIPIDILLKKDRLEGISVATKMNWATKRRTTRDEDEAYCLMGIFQVNMPLLYGEGSQAFMRLQREIIRKSNDKSILCTDHLDNLLAESPVDFNYCRQVLRHDQEQISPSAITNIGLEARDSLFVMTLKDSERLMSGLYHPVYLMPLGCFAMDYQPCNLVLWQCPESGDVTSASWGQNLLLGQAPPGRYRVFLALVEHNSKKVPGTKFFAKQAVIGISQDVDMHKIFEMQSFDRPYYIAFEVAEN